MKVAFRTDASLQIGTGHPLVVKPPTFDAYSARLYVTNSQP